MSLYRQPANIIIRGRTLQQILDLHAEWRRTRYDASPKGERANLRYSNLRGSDLRSANLSGSDLSGSDLSYSNLRGSNLRGSDLNERTRLDTGETFALYLSDVLPHLLTSGGKTVKEVVESGAWECHDWNNCPMHVAFDAGDVSETPLLLQPRVRQFVALFDARLLPVPTASE